MSTDAAIGLLMTASLPMLLFGVLFALSRYGGWSQLADRYPSRGPFPKPATQLGYAVFRGWVGYNGCIVLAADATGLHIRTWPFLSLVHAPFFVPWGQVLEIVSESRGRVSRFRIETIGAPEVEFALRAGTFAHARDAARAAGVRGEY